MREWRKGEKDAVAGQEEMREVSTVAARPLASGTTGCARDAAAQEATAASAAAAAAAAPGAARSLLPGRPGGTRAS